MSGSSTYLNALLSKRGDTCKFCFLTSTGSSEVVSAPPWQAVQVAWLALQGQLPQQHSPAPTHFLPRGRLKLPTVHLHTPPIYSSTAGAIHWRHQHHHHQQSHDHPLNQKHFQTWCNALQCGGAIFNNDLPSFRPSNINLG